MVAFFLCQESHSVVVALRELLTSARLSPVWHKQSTSSSTRNGSQNKYSIDTNKNGGVGSHHISQCNQFSG